MDLTDQHSDNLVRNLSGINLAIDKVAIDGNFFFRAFARQLRKHLILFDEQIEGHCTLLGLGKSEEEDSETLRTHFVNKVNQVRRTNRRKISTFEKISRGKKLKRNLMIFS